MDKYLKETTFCNFSNQNITKIAKDFKEKCHDKKDLAVELFYFVRDNIKYSLGFWNKKASETLRRKTGTCTNSANLMIALLRSAGIPAGYGVLKVKGQKYLGEVVPVRLRKFIKRESTHVYVYVYINDKWLICDPSNDIHLSLNTQHFNKQSKLVDWNGDNNTDMPIDDNDIISNAGPIDNIDNLIDKKMKFHKIVPVKIANLYVAFLRDNGSRFKDALCAEKEFVSWLRKKHFFYYICYLSFSFVKMI